MNSWRWWVYSKLTPITTMRSKERQRRCANIDFCVPWLSSTCDLAISIVSHWLVQYRKLRITWIASSCQRFQEGMFPSHNISVQQLPQNQAFMNVRWGVNHCTTPGWEKWHNSWPWQYVSFQTVNSLCSDWNTVQISRFKLLYSIIQMVMPMLTVLHKWRRLRISLVCQPH